MSHVVLAKSKLKQSDLPFLIQACKALGLEFRENQKTHMWYGTWVDDYHGADAAYRQGVNTENYGKCSHAIRLPWSMHEAELYAKDPDARPYEIGVVVDSAGNLGLLFDNYSGGKGVAQMEHIAGKKLEKLIMKAAELKVLNTLAKSSSHYLKETKEEQLQDGRVCRIIRVGVRTGEVL